jgi:hypothetical protein
VEFRSQEPEGGVLIRPWDAPDSEEEVTGVAGVQELQNLEIQALYRRPELGTQEAEFRSSGCK